jgi:hypothetical protein
VSERLTDGAVAAVTAGELARLRAENARLLRLLKLTRREAAPPGPAQAGFFEAPPGPVHAGSPVGADNAFTSCGLRILVDQAAEPGASPDADFVVGRRHVSPAVGWLLAEGPVRPVGVVVIDILAEDVVEMSRPAMRMRSVHSCRALAIQRSQIAFARCARTGVAIVRAENPVHRSDLQGCSSSVRP